MKRPRRAANNFNNRVIFTNPEDQLTAKQRTEPVLNLSPMSDLDLMIKNGWGDTPQGKLPENWRTHKKTPKFWKPKGIARRHHAWGADVPESIPVDS